jgi:hypothetical protein
MCVFPNLARRIANTNECATAAGRLGVTPQELAEVLTDTDVVVHPHRQIRKQCARLLRERAAAIGPYDISEELIAVAEQLEERCATEPSEQDQVNVWANSYGPPLATVNLAGRMAREANEIHIAAIKGDSDAVLEHAAMSVLIAYRICGAHGCDLLEQVSAKFAALKTNPNSEPKF